MAKKKEKVIVAYKGFDKNFKCRDFQYEIGKKYVHDGEVNACGSGFHACENPLDIFQYYEPTSKFATVEMSGSISREKNSDSKIACSEIFVKAEIGIPEIVANAISWMTSNYSKKQQEHATGNRSASSATGDQSASSATGDQSASSATGYQSASSATGYQSASSATGYQSASSATGNQSASSVIGKNSVAINIGVFGKAKADIGGAITLCEHDLYNNLIAIKSALVGEGDGMLKPNVWYMLKNNEFIEAD